MNISSASSVGRASSLRGVRLQVVGAGVSGLSAAVLAAERGAEVELVDAAPGPGGLLAAHRFRDLDCDLGSHRLHRQALVDPTVARLLDDVELHRRPRRGVLLLDGRRIAYPPSALDLARGLRGAGAPFAAAFLLRPRRLARWDADRTDGGDDVGFEDFVRARVGDAAYRAFYRPYVEKVWGLDARDVSQTVAKARVSTSAPWALVGGRVLRALRRTLFAGGGEGADGSEIETDAFLYPARGMGALVRSLGARAARLGVVSAHGRRFEPSPSRGGPAVLFSGPLRELAPEHGGALTHRGVYLVYLALGVGRLDRFETYYTPEARWWFGRVAELQNYSPRLRRDGETVLCVEIPEGRWGGAVRFDRGGHHDALVEQLRDAAIVPRGVAVLAAEQRFVADVYPLYRRGWVATWERALDEAAARGAFVPFGRQGLFLHCNIDACIAMAAAAVDHLAAGGDAIGWKNKARTYLGVRVRD